MLRSKLNISLFICLIFTFVQYIEASNSLDTTICPQCEVINFCFGKYKQSNKFAIYPPDNVKDNLETGKCYCFPENINTYIECVKCYFTYIKPGNIPSDGKINGICSKMLEGSTTEGTTTKTPDTKTPDTKNVPNDPNNNNNNNNTTNNNTVTGGIQTGNSTMTNANGSNTNNSSSSTKPIGTLTQSNNSTNKNDQNNSGSSKSKIIMFSVIGAVVVVAAAGFFVYNKKKNSRPESMPFFGNTATSPRPYATLDLPKDTNTSSLQYGGSSNTLGFGSTSPLNYDFNPPQTQYDSQYGQYSSEYQQFDTVNTSAAVGTATAIAGSTAVATAVADNSVSYDPRRESMNQSANISMNDIGSGGQIYICSYPYEPKLDDELELRIDDEIQVLEEFEDGWMKAYNKTTMKEGMAPIVCIKP